MPAQVTYKTNTFSSQISLENTPVFHSDSSGKEKDSETGYYYFGARYYNPDLSLWLSVDPMADKYPSLSPYNYCAWNPMKIVDPDGMELADYYDRQGNYLGWDGHFDNKVHIVKDGTTIEKDANGLIDERKTSLAVSTTYETLDATIGVFNRTKANGGGKEESTAVIAGFSTINGETGYTGADGNPHCKFPYLTEEQKMLGITSVHSHTFTLEGDGYRDLTPSTDDKALFKTCVMNIIVGYISAPTEKTAYPYSENHIGAAFINSSLETKTTMSIRAIERIVSNRFKASNNHIKQAMRRP